MGSTARIWNSIESLEQFGYGFGGDSHSRVPDAKLSRASHSMYTDSNFSIKGELEGVRNQIQNNLLPHITINVYRLAKIVAIHYQSQARFVRGRTEYARQLRSESC